MQLFGCGQLTSKGPLTLSEAHVKQQQGFHEGLLSEQVLPFGFSLPNASGHCDSGCFKFPAREEQRRFLSSGGQHLPAEIDRAPRAAGTDFRGGGGCRGESIKPRCKLAHLDGNCSAGGEGGVFIWGTPGGVTAPGGLGLKGVIPAGW